MNKPNMNIMYIMIILIWIMNCDAGQKPIDLEKKKQSFVLETKQLSIPGFPGAFNPSIARWKDGIVMCFRVRNDKLISTFEIGFVWLDKDFNPIGTPSILHIKGNPSSFSRNQDPRLITMNGNLYIVYSNFIKIDEIVTRRMFIAQVHHKKEKFFIMNPKCLHPFENWSSRWEKNWVPFVHGGKILLAYSLIPHRILQPSLKSGKCVTINSSNSSIEWDWGELRGGTPALFDGKEYLAFFHSSKKMATTHSNGKSMTHYFMGAYTFSAKPPFEITRISPFPIIGKNFYNGPAHNTWKPLRVVFPTGYLMDEKYVWITYGRQDFEIWIAKIDKKGLYKSLVKCPKITTKFEWPDVCPDEEEIDSLLDTYFDTSFENSAYENS